METSLAFMSDADREESIIERKDRERGDAGKVENEDVLPLFPDAKQDQRKTVVHLQVTKLNPPNDGFKGNIPPGSDAEAIAKLYGNGIFEVHAITATGKSIRRTQLKIAWEAPPDNKPVVKEAPSGDATMHLLHWQAEESSKQNSRIKEMSESALQSTREFAKQQTDVLTKQTETSMERERNMYTGLLQQQQVFFQSMMQQSELNHRQAMERAERSFQQTIQVTQQASERARQASDPRLLLSLFQQGFMLARGMEAEDEPEDDENDESQQPWVKVLTEGIGAVKDITELAKLKAVVKKDPNAAPPAKTTENQSDTTKPRGRKKAKIPFTREELAELIRAKRLAEQKGIDFGSTVRNAARVLFAGAEVDATEPETQSNDESGESEESDSADAGASESDDT